MKVVINEWVPVGVWSWTMTGGEVCGICRVRLEGTCPECTFPGPKCPPVIGHCSHQFHSHCINKWLELGYSNGLCPMCRQRWEEQTAEELVPSHPSELPQNISEISENVDFSA